jgi:ribA/ribD-fused uncharacterized protein
MRPTIDSFEGEYRFLSNFWPVIIPFEGKNYPSLEHAYQAAKTTNMELRKHISELPKPGKAKYFGRNLGENLRPDWTDEMRLATMTVLVRAKFLDNAGLARELLNTGDAELVEGNKHHDNFYGVCDGVGENNLGKILMKVRQELLQDIADVNNALAKKNGSKKLAAAALGISERALSFKIKQYDGFGN